MHAEAFAKRGLGKVNELQEIEKMSTSEATPESEAAFRQAKTKMQVMIFKRVVFETRKRPKGLLRPKTKPNLKDFAHVSNSIGGILWYVHVQPHQCVRSYVCLYVFYVSNYVK